MIVGLHGSVAPAMAGLALTYSAHISGVFQYTIRLLSETEVRFISVEQINRYCEVRIHALKTSRWLCRRLNGNSVILAVKTYIGEVDLSLL